MLIKPKLIIFDVNETLLDLEPLKIKVNAILENSNAFEIWFRMLLHYSLVETTTGGYKGFGAIGKATFKMLTTQLQITISEDQIDVVLGTIRNLPPHSDVKTGLSKLKESGYKLMALTNSSTETMTAQLKFAEIDDYFDAFISVEEIKKYKPHPDTYKYVLDKYNLPAAEALMLAAHAWDILGAKRCGLQTAFINRPGKQLYPLEGSPDMTGSNIVDIAEQLRKMYI